MTDELLRRVEELEQAAQSGSEYQLTEDNARLLLDQESLSSNAVLEARVLLVLAGTLLHQSRTDEAQSYIERAHHLATQSGDKTLQAEVFAKRGHAMLETNDLQQAFEFYIQALLLSEESAYKQGIAANTAHIGLVYLRRSQNAQALEHLQRSLMLHQELGNDRMIASDLLNLGVVYSQTADYTRALESALKAMSIYESMRDTRALAMCCIAIGNLYQNISDYSRALEFFEQGIMHSRVLGLAAIESTLFECIGNLYTRLDETPRALEYYQLALECKPQAAREKGMANLLGNMGGAYLSIENYPKAIEYLEGALEQSRRSGNKRQQGYWLTSLGRAMFGMQRFNEAIEYLTTALNLRLNEIGSEEGVSSTLRYLAAAQCDNKNYEAALESANKSLEIAVRLGEKDSESHTHNSLAYVHEKLGNIDKAYFHLKEYQRLNEELQNTDARKKAEQLDHSRREAEREKKLIAQRAAEQAEKEATMRLLHKVLPESVASRLLNGERVADYFPAISILFADIVGFTPIAAQMSAKDVLAFLNYVFGEFDRIMKTHGCQKIKTMGDGYLAVAGAPVQVDDHAERCAAAALELLHDISLPDDIRQTLPQGSVFHLRIGLHTGAAFAGIIGEDGFVYDVYSDAVNLASRMESSGEGGKIHCSEDFVRHVQQRSTQFHFVERGEIPIKGKGIMRTYFLSQQE